MIPYPIGIARETNKTTFMNFETYIMKIPYLLFYSINKLSKAFTENDKSQSTFCLTGLLFSVPRTVCTSAITTCVCVYNI